MKFESNSLKSAHFDVAEEILGLAMNGSIKAFVTPSIVHICGYWLTKAYNQDKAKKIILSLLADVKCLDITHEITIAALHSSIKDIGDAMQYYTALHHKADYFITRDKQLHKEAISILPAYSPEEFLKEMRNK
ncbi:MAG: PIN domain-containing protein [Chitinophagaceae bacterium]